MHASWSHRAGALAATILAALAGPAAFGTATGHAATYNVYQCHSGTGYETNALVGSYRGAYATFNVGCPSADRSVGGALNPTVEYGDGDHAAVTFSAPSGTTIDYLIARRDARAGGYRSFGTPVAHLFANPGGVIEAFSSLPGSTASANGDIAVPLGGKSSVSWGAVCNGGAGCPAGDTHYLLRDVAIGLSDASAPSISSIGGTLRDETNRARLRSLNYSAADSGGGVYSHRLIIDGTARALEKPDLNGGKCVFPFSAAVPCKTSTNGTVSLDTATLPDGSHELTLDVRDATDDNKTLHGPWTIVVDNTPPSVGPPALTGTAREGETLTCTAEVAGQGATAAFQWLRAAIDGSGAVEIAGATNAAYTMTSADIGKKLVCRVTGTDGGGSRSSSSTITQEPFDEGRTVTPYCAGQPAGPNDECGDLDGDGIPNRSDDDIDGDSIPNATDIAPSDASRPGPGASSPGNQGGQQATGSSNTSSNTTTSNSSTSSSSTSQTTTLGAVGTVKFLLGRETATFIGRQARWLRSAFTLRGRLTAIDGQPIVGLRLYVSQTVRGRTVALGTTTAGADGSWAFKVPRGPRRTITVTAGDGVNAATMTVQQRVVAHVTFRVVRKRVRSGGLVHFRGQLRGGYTNSREKLVEFQVYYRRAWRTIGTLRVNSDGKFSVRYRFGTGAYGRYKFRARTMPTDGYPFAVGTSSTKAATVRVG